MKLEYVALQQLLDSAVLQLREHTENMARNCTNSEK